jgi:ribosomal-protein-alanine N-acetyltransferase
MTGNTGNSSLRLSKPVGVVNWPLPHCTVRSWDRRDAASLARHANDREIWRNLRDAFPSPYTLRHASTFIADSRRMRPEQRFAIAVEGQAIGSIGFAPHLDVERVSAEIGYWVGRAFWGRGIATEALVAVTRYAIGEFALTRVYAVPFDFNLASCRVLEKAGYVREGRMRRSAIKEGRVIDQFLYAFTPGA